MTEVSLAQPNQNQAGGVPGLIALGFSVRALAQALRPLTNHLAGLDHFGDQDLADVCDSLLCPQSWSQTPETIREIICELRTLQPTDNFRADAAGDRILLGGGTENWPELMEALHQNFRVLGPTPEQLEQLRSLDAWRNWAADSGIRFPATRTCRLGADAKSLTNREQHSPTGNWLLKSIRSSGGLGVREFTTGHAFSDADYLQEKIEGRSLGVTCILEPSGCSYLGATEAFSSHDWPAPSEYIYRGSWGKFQLGEPTLAAVQQLANRVQTETGLLGWLQMDLIEDAAGDVWLIEMNPRWTAGMEVLFDCGTNAAVHHLRAWGVEAACPSPLTPADSRPITCAKAIIYTPKEISFRQETIEKLHALPREHFSDIPSTQMTGAAIPPGQPLLTVRSRTPQTNNPASDKTVLLEHLNALQQQVLSIL